MAGHNIECKPESSIIADAKLRGFDFDPTKPGESIHFNFDPTKPGEARLRGFDFDPTKPGFSRKMIRNGFDFNPTKPGATFEKHLVSPLSRFLFENLFTVPKGVDTSKIVVPEAIREDRVLSEAFRRLRANPASKDVTDEQLVDVLNQLNTSDNNELHRLEHFLFPKETGRRDRELLQSIGGPRKKN